MAEKIKTISIIEDNLEIANWIVAQIRKSETLKFLDLFSSSETADLKLWKNPPNLIVLDLGLPGKSGLDFLIEIRSRLPLVKVLVFTVFEDEKNILKAITNGCHGYWIKNLLRPEQLIDECQVVLDGGASLTPKIARYMMEYISTKQQARIVQENPLTVKETKVLNLVSIGYPLSEVAEELDISSHTVRHTLERVYEKLQVNSKREAILKGNRLGILRNDE